MWPLRPLVVPKVALNLREFRLDLGQQSFPLRHGGIRFRKTPAISANQRPRLPSLSTDLPENTNVVTDDVEHLIFCQVSPTSVQMVTETLNMYRPIRAYVGIFVVTETLTMYRPITAYVGYLCCYINPETQA